MSFLKTAVFLDNEFLYIVKNPTVTKIIYRNIKIIDLYEIKKENNILNFQALC